MLTKHFRLELFDDSELGMTCFFVYLVDKIISKSILDLTYFIYLTLNFIFSSIWCILNIKGVIRRCKSNNRQYNDQQRNKTKTWTMVLKTLHGKIKIEQHKRKTGSELRCSGKVGSSYSSNGTCDVTFNQHEHHMIWK